jgi:hypothetical protein
MKCFSMALIIVATRNVSKNLKNIWRQYQDNVQYILYKKVPY